MFCCSIKVRDSSIKNALVNYTCLESQFSNAFNHGRKCFFGETVNKIRFAAVNIDQAGRDTDGVKTRPAQQRIKFPANIGVAPGPTLQFDLTLNRFVGCFTVRMEIGGAMISFYDRDGSALAENTLQCLERIQGL